MLLESDLFGQAPPRVDLHRGPLTSPPEVVDPDALQSCGLARPLGRAWMSCQGDTSPGPGSTKPPPASAGEGSDNTGCGGAIRSNCATLEIPNEDHYARGRRARVA